MSQRMAVPVEAKNDLQFIAGKKMGTLALLLQGDEFLASAHAVPDTHSQRPEPENGNPGNSFRLP